MSKLFAFNASNQTTDIASEGCYDASQQLWLGNEEAVGAGIFCYNDLVLCDISSRNRRRGRPIGCVGPCFRNPVNSAEFCFIEFCP